MTNEEAQVWYPKRIDVEATFSAFVRTFRNGRIVRELMPDAPTMTLNADYFFPDAGVVMELKTLEADASSSDARSRRLVAAYRAAGYSGSDLFGFLFRGEPMPNDVQEKFGRLLANPIAKAVKRANKQIRATKRFLRAETALGVVAVANSNNYGLSPGAIFGAIARAATSLEDNHTDAVVYFTPNVYHDIEGSDVAHQIWTAAYRDEQTDRLVEFVNDLGRAWGDFSEMTSGDKYLERAEIPDEEEGLHLLRAAVSVRPPE